MRPITEAARGMWWAFAAVGGVAFVAALAAAADLAPSTTVIGAWCVVAGAVVIAAAWRAPGGLAGAAPFLGAALAGLVLGVALVVLPARELRTGVIAVGIWGLVAGAGYLAVARVARALGLPDGGLYGTAWVGIAAGMVIVMLPVFGFQATSLTAAAVLASTGMITMFASARLRVLPLEAPAQPSKREMRRRERAGRRR